MKKLILASQSPRRKELLNEAGFTFEIVPSQIEESFDFKLSPKKNAIRLAETKAKDVLKKIKHDKSSVILAADTLVVLGNKIFGKPKDLDDARHMLHTLSHHTHQVITAVVILHFHSSTHIKIEKHIVETKVKFKKLNLKMIENYLKTENPLDKAGAYAIQTDGLEFIESIKGSLTNVMGLPMETVIPLLEKVGIRRVCSKEK